MYLVLDSVLIFLWFQIYVGGDQVHSDDWSDWSAWSGCSTQCEYGISTRTRICLRSGILGEDGSVLPEQSQLCVGVSSQIKVCNLKPCLPEQTSQHQRSCSQFDSRMFSGKHYVWEPIIHPNDACKLSCRAKGVQFYANMADKSEDGTPCKLGGTTEAICVKGVCKRIGCDGVVESRATTDTCGVCDGDSSSCQTISGIFTSTDLKRGLNYVISIPPGSTNINITDLQATRSLLVLQTGTGKAFINDDFNNPVSTVAEAAGTVFTYVAKSMANPKQTISAPGPTNVSVILKILMRGGNPGIIYTFSVPKDISQTVIQQIRHHSQPVELPPESNAHRHPHFQALNNKDDDLISLPNPTIKPGYIESSSINTFPESRDQYHHDKLEVIPDSDQDGITQYETPAPSLSEPEFSAHGGSSSVYKEDTDNASDISPSIPDYLSVDDISFGTAAPHVVPDSHTIDYLSTANNPVETHSSNTRTETVRFDNQAGVEDHVETGSLGSEATQFPGEVRDDKTSDDYKHGNNTELNNGTEHAISFINGGSTLDKEEVRSAVEDHRIGSRDDSFYSPQDEMSQRSTQSWRFPINGLEDSNDNVHQSSDRENSLDIQSANIHNVSKDGFEKSIWNISEAKQREKEALNNNWVSTPSTDVSNDSIVRSRDNDLNKYISPYVSTTDGSKTGTNVGNADNLETNETSNPNSHKNLSRYKIPRYSQSFTFAERYKDTLKRNNSRKSSYRSRGQHSRRRHGDFQNISQHNQPAESQSNHQAIERRDNQRTEFERNHDRNVDYVHGVDSGYNDLSDFHETKEEAAIRNSTNLILKPHHANGNTQAISSDRHQRDRNGQVSRELRLKDREAVIEERRRRMEEQRLRYNERLREYQEMLRQRQTETDKSHRQSSFAVNTSRATDHRTSDESGNPGGQYQYETNRSLPHRDSVHPTLHQTSVYSGSNPKTHSFHPGRADSGKDNRLTSVRDRDTFTGPSTGSTIVRPGHSSDRRQEQIERRQRTHTQTDASWRRQSVFRPSRREGDDSYSSRDINRDSGTHNSDRHLSREASSGQPRSPNVPTIMQPPRLEYPESFNGDRTNTYPSWNISKLQSSGPRYIPGISSRAAYHSALTGSEVPAEPPSDGDSGDSRILTNRQPTVPKPAESGDTLSNQMSLNKPETVHHVRSAIYEWRVSGLTECTHSCGGGVQQTVVVCVETLTQAVVTDENCRHIPKPKLLGVPCNTRPCSAEWTPGLWSPCSVTCGSGEQMRSVTCQARVSATLNMVMSNASCENQNRIPNRQTCSSKPCSSWRVGVWSNCSASCGDGQKTRDVQCVDLQSNVVSDDACSDLMPDSEERCNVGECGKGWFFTDWPTECPAECGTGELTRQVFCADDTGSALPDSRCDVTQRPALTQSCRVNRPCGGLWFTDKWSKCHVGCGSGNRRRSVLCIKELPGSVQAVVDEENCEGLDKPAETEPCQAPACTSEWYMTSWSQCSQSCGTGYRTREVKCLDPNQRPQDDCSLPGRPKTRDPCNTNSCLHVVPVDNEEDLTCVDKFAQCKVVKRARLCRYGYYKTSCCKSCADDT